MAGPVTAWWDLQQEAELLLLQIDGMEIVIDCG